MVELAATKNLFYGFSLNEWVKCSLLAGAQLLVHLNAKTNIKYSLRKVVEITSKA